VTAALQQYADRGVFRGFSATGGPRGRIDYEFTWLIRRPMRASFDRARRALAFPQLFPSVDARSGLAAELRRLIRERSTTAVPAHKRLDGRRAKVAGAVRQGGFNLTIEIRGAHDQYGVRAALNLINEMFLLLHEKYPDYLTQHFGLSPE
jgi:hypothetical protein